MAFRVVLLGAGGIFGNRLARRLAGDGRFELVLAGRTHAVLQELAGELRNAAGGGVTIAVLDALADDFATRLASLRAQLVIHAAGPFQLQDYRVAQACLDCGSHYVDLADGRDFVAGITRLDAAARSAGRLVASGASSVPALSSAVVDAWMSRFARLDRIESAISPGNRTPRGDATVASILGYCGRPIRVWRDARWQVAHGWMGTRRVRLANARRLVGICDVPDLELFPQRYPGVRTVQFRAGLELPLLHGGTWLAAALVRMGVLRDLARHAGRLRRWSEWFMRWGSDVGGMTVELSGEDASGRPLRVRWWLEAAAGEGPEVPVTPALVLAQRLADGTLPVIGAMPCVGLLDLEALMAALAPFAVRSGAEVLP
jgi:saccharopine dehydrogenase-like NADP-dependent oxidoreductase